MVRVAVDLDREEDRGPGEVEAVATIAVYSQLDLRQWQAGSDDEAVRLGFEDARGRCSDKAPFGQVGPQRGDTGTALSGQAVDLGAQTIGGDQPGPDGDVDRTGELGRFRDGGQVHQGPERIGHQDRLAGRQLYQVEVP
jgi:hypothetical protein